MTFCIQVASLGKDDVCKLQCDPDLDKIYYEGVYIYHFIPMKWIS